MIENKVSFYLNYRLSIYSNFFEYKIFLKIYFVNVFMKKTLLKKKYDVLQVLKKITYFCDYVFFFKIKLGL